MIKQHRVHPFFGYPHRWQKASKEYYRKFWKESCPYSTRWRLCVSIIVDMKRKNEAIAMEAVGRANMRKFGGA